MVTECQNIANRSLLKIASKDPLGAGLASMYIGSATHIKSATSCLALQKLQIPERSTNKTLPKYIFPRFPPDNQRLTSGHLDGILVVPMKHAPRTSSWYPSRSKGGQGEQGALNASHSHLTCFQGPPP
eukprot:1133716-Pelagomonas_calceolata.AAC.6